MRILSDQGDILTAVSPITRKETAEMKITQKITPAVIQAATAMLSPYVPEISPSGLMEAIRNYSNVPEPERKENLKPYTRTEVCELLALYNFLYFDHNWSFLLLLYL